MMIKKILCRIVLLFGLTAVACAQSSTESPSKSAGDSQSAGSDADTKALKTDLEKMRVLVEQMQRNVAFVSPGDTPLKHQFQLEIEMWRLLLKDIEKRTNPQESH